MAEKSRFRLVFDAGASEVNRRPNLVGEFALAGEDATEKLALWGGKSEKTGKLYARGTATPETVLGAVASRTATPDAGQPAPNGIELKVGEAVIFENDKRTPDNRQPHVYGYARRASGFVRLAGWDRGGVVTGTAEPYRPAATAVAPRPEGPAKG